MQCAKLYTEPEPFELQQQQQNPADTGNTDTTTSSTQQQQQQQQQLNMTQQGYAECMHGVMALLGRQRTGGEQSEPHERTFFKFQNSRCVCASAL